MNIEEINKELSKQTDGELLKLEIGCWNVFYFHEAPCPYNDGGHCRRGAMLTSTLIGAHPIDCPLRRKR